MENDGNRQKEMLRATIPFIVLAIISVIARYFSRKFRQAPFGADDLVILLALILAIADFVVVPIFISFGEGQHTAKAPKWKVTQHSKLVFAGSMIYAATVTTIKISILLFYQRIFATPKFVLATRIVGAIVVAWWITTELIQIFSCRPINGFWNTSVPSKCVNAAQFYLAVAVPNIFTDIVMLCMPIRMIWQLQTSRIQKVALSLTFLTGGFVTIASLYRAILLHRVTREDPLWTYTDVTIWTSIEPSIGIVCSCLPTLSPLFREAWCRGKSFPTTISSFQSRGRLVTAIELGSNKNQVLPKKDLPRHAKWENKDFDLGSNNMTSRETTITASKGNMDPERDDRLLSGINVQHDVHVKRAPFDIQYSHFSE